MQNSNIVVAASLIVCYFIGAHHTHHIRLLRGGPLIIIHVNGMESNTWKTSVQYHSIDYVPAITTSLSSSMKVPPTSHTLAHPHPVSTRGNIDTACHL